jgi:hypothetical protein
MIGMLKSELKALSEGLKGKLIEVDEYTIRTDQTEFKFDSEGRIIKINTIEVVK